MKLTNEEIQKIEKLLRDSSYVILFENQIQTASASPYRTQVQLTASFLVCFLIFIEYKSSNHFEVSKFYFKLSLRKLYYSEEL